jgi:lysophospholipid acyltransferase (LPLAT)-like uncharacterized protein
MARNATSRGIKQPRTDLIRKSLRKRIERSEVFATCIASVAGWYLSYCNKTTDWTIEGRKDLEAALAHGPVLLVMWHSRSVMGALHWPVAAGPLSSLYDKSPIGRVSGALQRRVGLHPIEMSRKLSNRNASRVILRRVKDGVSIGMTGDGPLGPARLVKDAPLEWARITGMPVFCYAFATTKGRRLDTWDRMLVPKPRGRGAQVFRRFEVAIPRKLDDPSREALRQDLQRTLDETTASADRILRP